MPSAPLDLTVLKATDTSVKLRWLEPKSANGILHGYQINLTNVGAQTNESRRLTDPQSVMEHTIGELTPFTWYKASVQAYSRRHLGDSSSQVKFRTDVSAPSAPEVLNLTCFDQNSIQLQWQRPERFYNQIESYHVQYRLADQPDGWQAANESVLAAKKDKPVSQLLITELAAEQLYEVRVSAATRSVLDPALLYKSEPSPTLRVVLQANCESKYIFSACCAACCWRAGLPGSPPPRQVAPPLAQLPASQLVARDKLRQAGRMCAAQSAPI